MKPPQSVRDELSRRKAETADPDLNENYRYMGAQGVEAYRQSPVEQTTRPTSPIEAKPPPGSRGVRMGGSGGGASFKTNTGRKSGMPMPSDFTLNVYAKGGQVGKVGSFGLKRSKPDFAGGGDKTNFKMSTKKGKMPW